MGSGRPVAFTRIRAITPRPYRTVGQAIPPGETRRWFVIYPSGNRALGGGVATDPGYSVTQAEVLETAPANDNATGGQVVSRTTMAR